MNTCFNEWEISKKIIIAVNDYAANITSAISLNTNWHHIPCLPRSFNLIAQRGLLNIQNVHKKVKGIIEFLNDQQNYCLN